MSQRNPESMIPAELLPVMSAVGAVSACSSRMAALDSILKTASDEDVIATLKSDFERARTEFDALLVALDRARQMPHTMTRMERLHALADYPAAQRKTDRLTRAPDWPPELNKACDRVEALTDEMLNSESPPTILRLLGEIREARSEFGRQLLALDNQRRAAGAN